MARPGLRLKLAAIAVVALAALGAASRADAHAILQSSRPASGAALDASPKEVVLDFNEKVQFDLGGITLRSGDGTNIAIGATHHRDGADDVIAASVPELTAGVYVVGYRVVSADGHPVSGDIVFRVGAGSLDGVRASTPSTDRWVGIVYGALRFAVYPALVLSLGIWLFALLVWPPLWWRSRRLVDVVAGTVIMASLAQFVVAVPYLRGTGFASAFDTARWSDVAHTDLGRWLLVRAVCGVGLTLSIVRVRRWRVGRSTGLLVAAAPLIGLAVTVVGDGHAEAGRWFVVGWVATLLHVGAMCLWLAGLGVIAWGMRQGDVDLYDNVRRRWSRIAAASVAIIVVSGVVQAWRLLPDAHALSSSYGRLLIAKTVLVVVMLVLGNVGRVVLARPADDWPTTLRRSVAVEVLVGLAVLVLTTVLVQTEPGGTRAAADAATTRTTTVTGTQGDRTEWTTTLRLGQRSMTLTLDGLTTGRHRMTLVVDDSAQPFADPVTLDARLTLSAQGLGPIPVLFDSSSRLHWSTDALELPAAGDWRLEVFVIDSGSKARFATTLSITDAGATS